MSRSTDGGATWTSFENAVSNQDIAVVRIDPQDPQILYAASGLCFEGQNCGVFKSQDGGESWVQTSGDIQSPVLILDGHDSTRLWQGGWVDERRPRRRLLRSEDSGQSWTTAEQGLPQEGFFNTRVQDLVQAPSSPDLLFARLRTQDETFQRTERWFKSQDGGDTWEPFDPPLTDPIHLLRLDPTNSDRIYVLTGTLAGTLTGFPLNRQVWKSMDSGQSWQRMDSGLLAERVFDLEMDPVNPELLYVALATGGVWRSRDGGETWEKSGLEEGPSIVDIATNAPIQTRGSSGQPGILYAVSSTGAISPILFKSHDQGDSWQDISRPSSVRGPPRDYFDWRPIHGPQIPSM